MKIAINTSSFGEHSKAPLEILESKGVEYSLNPHQRTLKQDEVVDLVKGADGVIAGVEPFNESVLQSLSGLKVISRCGVGMDNVDLNAANSMNIEVLNTPKGPTLAVAELTVGVMLNLLRKINIQDSQLKSGVWKKQMGNLLSGKKIGIVGFGSIGQKVGQLLDGFGVELSYFDVCEIQGAKVSRAEGLRELLSWADIVTLHVSKSGSDGYLIGEEEINTMNKGSWLINMSRGGVVDESALLQALESDQLAGAALDVYEEEPYNGALIKNEKVILTPHIGSYAKEARIEMEIESVNNLLKGLNI